MDRDLARKKVSLLVKKYEKITKEIREVAKKLLENNEVEKVIGFGKGLILDEITPIFISKVEDVDRLEFTPEAENSLAKYLLNYKGRNVAIVAKPCDSRAIASYLSENLINRDEVTIIGINGCPGIEDNTACKECDIRNAVIGDYYVGEKMTEEDIKKEIKEKEDKIEKMSPKERMDTLEVNLKDVPVVMLVVKPVLSVTVKSVLQTVINQTG
jgi:hypothetical protein